jgi:hypothetical protein
MARKYKVVQCPECAEYTYVPEGVHRNSCPRCNAQVSLHTLDGVIVKTSRTAQRVVQEYQSAMHGMAKPTRLGENQNPAKQVLQILRSHRSEYPQWLPLHELFQQCIDAGLLPKEVHEAIDLLNAEGFLEKREDTIRAIPLN